jgi:CRISPR-associated endoribonuclease Cas6
MRIRLRFQGPLSVPVAYHLLLQRTLYSLFPPEIIRAWRERHGFRPLTFSRLLGRTRIVQQQLFLSGPIDWWISFRQADEALSLLDGIQTQPTLVIGGQRMAISDLEIEPPFVWTRDMMGVTTLSPIVADDNVKGRIVSYAPDDPRFQSHIRHNAQAKALQFLGRPINALTIRPLETSCVRSWYGTTPVIGYRGQFLLTGEPALLELLYDVGIGRRNGLGFGCCYAFLPNAEQVPGHHA